MTLTQRVKAAANLKRLAEHKPHDRFNAAAKGAVLYKAFKALGLLDGMPLDEFVLLSMSADGVTPND